MVSIPGTDLPCVAITFRFRSKPGADIGDSYLKISASLVSAWFQRFRTNSKAPA